MGTRTRNRTRGAVAALGVAALVLAGACSSTTEDQVVSAGPGTTGNPQSPAVDNPTTSALTAPPTSPASTTTTDPDVAATTATTQPSTTATSVGPATSVPGESVVDGSLTMQLFWVRPPDDPRPLDLPGYRDPESGPRPLVVYGSATNDTGAAVPGPRAVVVFRDAQGTAVAAFATDVLLPGSTTPAPSLEPGASGDVIVVIEGAPADQLADLTPELRGGAAA